MPPRTRSPRGGPARRRATLSLDVIIESAIELLDRVGVAGFTLRGLAQEVDAGLGSVYWYVDGKDDLVARAANAVIGRAVVDIDAMRDGELDPASIGAAGEGPPARRKATTLALGEVRRMLLALFHQMSLHGWVAPQVQAEAGIAHYASSLILWDRVGQELTGLGLSARAAFHASTALLNYVTGVGAAEAFRDLRVDEGQYVGPRAQAFDRMLEEWLGSVGVDLPFVREIAPVMRDHDDFEQFAAGLDLLLVGVRHQVEGR